MKEETLIPKKARIVGGLGEGTKKIYISKDAYQKIFTFSKDKNVRQEGGVLLGNVIYEEGITYVIIKDFIEAMYSEGTSNSITFTKDTWKYIDEEKEKKNEYDIVGWMHTNPDTGCEATEYDVFFHSHMFEKENMVEYIVDPVQIVEAFYFLEDGKMLKNDGFYLFMDTKSKKLKKSRKDEGKSIPADTEMKSVIEAESQIGDHEDELRAVFKEAEKRVEEDKSDIEACNFGRLSDNIDISDINIPERFSVKMKVLVSVLTVLVIALVISVGAMAVRITQLEKDIEKLYQNDEVIAHYINEEDETTENVKVEEDTEDMTVEETTK